MSSPLTPMNRSTFHQATKRQIPALCQGVLNSVRNVDLNWCVQKGDFSRVPYWHSPGSRFPCALLSDPCSSGMLRFQWLNQECPAPASLFWQLLSASSWWVSRGAASERQVFQETNGKERVWTRHLVKGEILGGSQSFLYANQSIVRYTSCM